MKAYGELLAACAKTVDEFARDNITDGAARDHIKSRFPSTVRVDTQGDTARLRLAQDGADTAEISRAYNVSEVDLDDDDSEAALVAAAKLELAKQRQQLMATMVLLGINRIVVTNGQINAKVVFDMRADDSARRQATAEMHDEAKSSSVAAQHGIAVLPWAAGGAFSAQTQSHVATVSSAVDETSEAKAEVKAQLSGEVQLKFKSETFPLEKMISSGGLALLSARAEPPGLGRNVAPAAPVQAPVQAQPAQPAQPPPADGVRR
jgi:phage FluMu protein gp41